MYTQCPDCATSFKVTADVLKQAAGKVRCGGCGNAFNALNYLSETKPSTPPGDDTEEALPELRPDTLDETGKAATSPRMSAEQSAALLKTLDELAGSDIRLEDTGVEWRLLPDSDDESDDDASADVFAQADTPVDAELSADAGESRIDELLDDTPAEVDEYLSETPGEVDAAEVFDDASASSADELRFDDETGLPEDFDFDSAAAATAEPDVVLEPVPVLVEPKAHSDTQVDLVFGDPDEWGELLDEVDINEPLEDKPASPPAVDMGEAIIAPEASEDEAESGPSFEDELDALPDDDIPPDIDTQFDLQAEALGIDTSGMRKLDEDIEDTSIDEDLIAAAFETEKAKQGSGHAETEEAALEEPEREETEEEDSEPDDAAADVFEPDEAELEVAELDDVELEAIAKEDAESEETFALSEASDDDEDIVFPDSTGELEVELAKAQEHSDEVLALIAENLPDDAANDEPEAAPIDDVPPETEEEQTINRMIDQDLLRLAIENDDDDTDEDAAVAREDKPAAAASGMGMGVETIIMEGEFVRTALEQEALEQEAREASANSTDDEPEHSFVAAAKRTFRGNIVKDDVEGGSRHYRLVAGIAVLSLILAGQFVHQSRAELATIPAVNTVLGPVYRAIGAPITPNWDVTGWRFEVTRGSTNASGLAAELKADGTGVDLVADSTTPDAVDDDDVGDTDVTEVAEPEVLTIYSRVGNKSDQPLPYPLVSVSLTDRFEETIGSKVLEPSAYLTGNFDPRRQVPPGNTFDAVIAIESPAAEATGFKLNVCYRQAGGKLRCAVEDFK